MKEKKMVGFLGKKWLACFLSVSLLALAMPSVSYAGVVSTQQYMALSQRDQSIANIDRFVSREAVRDQMLALGVEPAEVQERIAALSEAELQSLEQSLDSLPAGGNLLGVIGLVFVVLLILELTGTIDIFKKA